MLFQIELTGPTGCSESPPVVALMKSAERLRAVADFESRCGKRDFVIVVIVVVFRDTGTEARLIFGNRFIQCRE